MSTAEELTAEVDTRWSAQVDEAVAMVAWSPDGTELAAGSCGGDAVVLGADDGACRNLARHGDGVRCGAWSPDGARLATGGEDSSVVVSARDGSSARIAVRGWVNDLAWAPRSGRLAVAAGSDVLVMEADTSTVADYPFLDGTVNALAWTGSPPRLAAATLGAVHWFDPTLTSREPERTARVVGAALALEASQDRTRLASGHLNGSLALWDPATGCGSAHSGYHGGVERLSWRSDGRQLAVAAHGELDVWRLDLDGAVIDAPLPITPTDGTLRGLAFHPTRPLLASGGLEGEVCLWEPDAEEALVIALEMDHEITALAWSPHGEALAIGTRSGSVCCLQVELVGRQAGSSST